MEPHVQYAKTAEGHSIACTRFGSGPPLVMAATWPYSHFSRELAIAPMGAWHERIAQFAEVVRYDLRGTGLSDRNVNDVSLEAQVADLSAVVDQLGLRRFAIWGAIGGGPAAITYAARNPERVSHLLLWCALARAGDVDWPDAPAVGRLAPDNPKLFAEAYAHASFGWQDFDIAQQYAELVEAALTPEAMAAGWRDMARLDATPYLAAVEAPTLVLARRDVALFPVDLERRLAASIKGARLVVLEGSFLGPYAGDTDAVVRETCEFLSSGDGAAPDGLSERELQVLRLIAVGRSNQEIAEHLVISPNTVARHVSNIFTKTGVANRAEAASYAARNGLVPW
jgi:pimeloyl-ACP methyl ester carboxylesterase/DNA-binding CsgD family transcriptional regulator